MNSNPIVTDSPTLHSQADILQLQCQNFKKGIHIKVTFQVVVAQRVSFYEKFRMAVLNMNGYEY